MLRAVPLLLTAFRLLLGPAFLLAHAREYSELVLMLIVALAGLTDWLDGFLARRLKVVSRAGKLLDPFADALFCMLVFLSFAIQGTVSGQPFRWIVGILIFREAVVTFVLRPLALVRGSVMAARITGKVKTGLQFAAMLVVLAAAWLGWGGYTAVVALVYAVFAGVLGLSVASGIGYALQVASARPGGGDAAKEE